MPIEIKNVSITDPERAVPRLQQITTCLKDHSVTICIGTTGSGKSTLLDSICGLLPISSGSITIDNIPLWSGRKPSVRVIKKLGSVFQFPEQQLFSKSVQGEFSYSLRPLRLSKAEVGTRIIASLNRVGLPASIVPMSPFLLSGGQKRRVALATTFATLPSWLLLDEPTAGLDPDSIRQLAAFIDDFKKQKKSGGIIIATHDLDVFLPMADDVLLLKDGKLIKHLQTKDVYQRPDWLTEIGIALPSTLETQVAIRSLGGQFPPRHLTPQEMAEVIYTQIESKNQALDKVRNNCDVTPDSISFSSLTLSRYPQETQQTDFAKRGFFTIDPRVKWLLCIFLSGAILLQSDWLGITASICLTIIILLLSHISWQTIWKYSRPFTIVLLVSMILSATQFGGSAHMGSIHGFGLSFQPAVATFKSLIDILCVVELGLLLSATTSSQELKQALSQLLSPIRFRGVPIAAFTLCVSLLFRFIPMILSQLERFSRIARARGKHNPPMGQVSLQDIPAVIIPLLLAILQLGEDLSQAMEARGYENSAQNLTNLQELHMKRLDWLILWSTSIAVISLIIIRFYRFLSF